MTYTIQQKFIIKFLSIFVKKLLYFLNLLITFAEIS